MWNILLMQFSEKLIPNGFHKWSRLRKHCPWEADDTVPYFISFWVREHGLYKHCYQWVWNDSKVQTSVKHHIICSDQMTV